MPLMTAGLITGGIQALTGLFGASAAKKRQAAAAKQKRDAARKLQSLEDNRQEIINPYDSMEDLSGAIQNPYENLGVATQAAEMQAEQADISLANTLDTIAATGASAGGATALAQAALQSKKGISANIEQQEARNESLRAQGEQQQQQMIMAEKQRIQGAEAKGAEFMYREQENRDLAQMDRLSAQLQGAEAREMQASADRSNAISGAVGGIASTVGGMYQAGAFNPTPTTPSTTSMGSYDLSSFGTGINVPNIPTTKTF
jgi:chromosome segregation ATPase